MMALKLSLCPTTVWCEAAMAVEFAAGRAREAVPLPPMTVRGDGGPLLLDWQPFMAELVLERRRGTAVGHMVGLQAQLAHQTNVTLPAAVMVTSHVARVALCHAAWCMRKTVPDAGSSAVGQG